MKAASSEKLDKWTVGRVGMLYRDLTPEDLGGDVVISQIRLPFEGEVPDYVHYHMIAFQVIYCTAGRIKVVYEGQGPAFWLEAGDCVLQPPKIRHRVLECVAGSEVIEIASPADHETRAEDALTLPNERYERSRLFGSQRFVRVTGSDGVVEAVEAIFAESPGLDAHAEILRSAARHASAAVTFEG